MYIVYWNIVYSIMEAGGAGPSRPDTCPYTTCPYTAISLIRVLIVLYYFVVCYYILPHYVYILFIGNSSLCCMCFTSYQLCARVVCACVCVCVCVCVYVCVCMCVCVYNVYWNT